ncbi:MAG TPA: plastocyanin/azurin family copper-binding protein [Solirubrobacterales bacterium]|jgi:plastocyanin|nr:plastocyanin/azurin family copper-binding protein [Solirubrobacterales bacterium]
MKRASVVLVAVALALFGLTACGDDDDDDATTAAEETTTEEAAGGGGGGGGGTIDISAAAEGIAYDQEAVDAAAGTVTVNFDNPSATPHDVAVEDESGSQIGKTDVISESTASTTVDLQPGNYTFFCTVDGHREQGMEGTIAVN